MTNCYVNVHLNENLNTKDRRFLPMIEKAFQSYFNKLTPVIRFFIDFECVQCRKFLSLHCHTLSIDEKNRSIYI